MKSHEKALLKLLKRNGYLCTTNALGYRTFTKDGCRLVDIYPYPGKSTCDRFTEQIHRDNRPPEKETDWVADERKRAEAQALREAADAERVKNTRLGGLSKILTESEVDQVARKAERISADFHSLDRLIREAPLGAGRKR